MPAKAHIYTHEREKERERVRQREGEGERDTEREGEGEGEEEGEGNMHNKRIPKQLKAYRLYIYVTVHTKTYHKSAKLILRYRP